jgi:divalent metal cation (Fe/Co/Zn/Cd) transporter
MVYPILKEASLVLLDAFHSPETVAAIERIAKNVSQIKQVHSIRLRKLGSYLIGDMHVVLDKDMTVEEACAIATQIEAQTQKEFEDIIEMNVIIEAIGTK